MSVQYRLLDGYRMEIIEDEIEGRFVVRFPELPGCLTCAETLEGALENAKDAKKCWLEAAREDGVVIPPPYDREEDFDEKTTKMSVCALSGAAPCGLHEHGF